MPEKEPATKYFDGNNLYLIEETTILSAFIS